VSVRPSDYPPPFSASEFVSEPTDPADERIEVGILIVGAGPAGLACAIRLGQLLEEHPDVADRLGEVPVAVVEKGKQPGSHLLSGAVVNPRSLAAPLPGPLPRRGPAGLRRRSRRGRLHAHAPRRAAHPAAADDAQPRQRRLLARAARPLARRCAPRRAGR